jgi:hypothetical protein
MRTEQLYDLAVLWIDSIGRDAILFPEHNPDRYGGIELLSDRPSGNFGNSAPMLRSRYDPSMSHHESPPDPGRK